MLGELRWGEFWGEALPLCQRASFINSSSHQDQRNEASNHFQSRSSFQLPNSRSIKFGSFSFSSLFLPPWRRSLGIVEWSEQRKTNKCIDIKCANSQTGCFSKATRGECVCVVLRCRCCCLRYDLFMWTGFPSIYHSTMELPILLCLSFGDFMESWRVSYWKL